MTINKWFKYRFLYSPKSKRKKCICGICKKEFYVIPSNMKRGKGKFCSIQCYMAYRRRRHVTDKDSTKVCNTCKKVKSSKDFLFRRDTRDKKATQCSDCRKTTVLQSKYHISKTKASDLFQKQQYGKCECCGFTAKNSFKECGRSLQVDHNHITGKVRGVLCYKCNIILGLMHESSGHLYLLSEYLFNAMRNGNGPKFENYFKEIALKLNVSDRRANLYRSYTDILNIEYIN